MSSMRVLDTALADRRTRSCETKAGSVASGFGMKSIVFHTRPFVASTVLETFASPRFVFGPNVASAAVVKMLTHLPCSRACSP